MPYFKNQSVVFPGTKLVSVPIFTKTRWKSLVFLVLLFGIFLAGRVNAADFEETFDNAGVLGVTWIPVILADSGVDWEITGGNLKANVGSDTGLVYYTGGMGWKDYTLTIPGLFAPLGYEMGSGVVFRYQNANNFYYVSMGDDGSSYLALQKIAGGSPTVIRWKTVSAN